MQLQLRPEFESKLFEMIDAFIKENPIIINNIIEPSVNGIISDFDVKPMITQHVLSKLTSATDPIDIPELIKEAVIEMVQDGSSDLLSKIENGIRDYFEGEHFNQCVNDKLSEKMDDLDLRDSIDHYLEEKLDSRTIDNALDDAIENAVPSGDQLEDRVRDAINDSVDEVANEATILEKIDSHIENKLNPEFLNNEVRQYLSALNISATIPDLIRTLISDQIKIEISAQVPSLPVAVIPTNPPAHWIYMSSDDVKLLSAIVYSLKCSTNIHFQTSPEVDLTLRNTPR